MKEAANQLPTPNFQLPSSERVANQHAWDLGVGSWELITGFSAPWLLSLVLIAVGGDRGAVGVGELDAGAVARRLGRLGQLELGPGDGAAEPHHEVVGRHAHAHALVRPEN